MHIDREIEVKKRQKGKRQKTFSSNIDIAKLISKTNAAKGKKKRQISGKMFIIQRNV